MSQPFGITVFTGLFLSLLHQTKFQRNMQVIEGASMHVQVKVKQSILAGEYRLVEGLTILTYTIHR
jgi:hypothetical protein